MRDVVRALPTEAPRVCRPRLKAAVVPEEWSDEEEAQALREVISEEVGEVRPAPARSGPLRGLGRRPCVSAVARKANAARGSRARKPPPKKTAPSKPRRQADAAVEDVEDDEEEDEEDDGRQPPCVVAARPAQAHPGPPRCLGRKRVRRDEQEGAVRQNAKRKEDALDQEQQLPSAKARRAMKVVSHPAPRKQRATPVTTKGRSAPASATESSSECRSRKRNSRAIVAVAPDATARPPGRGRGAEGAAAVVPPGKRRRTHE